jgi:single-strand DNA-binding protein
MSSYNRVTLVGNLTRQPELRKTKTGSAVTELGVALNRVWTGENGQKQEETTYVDVTVWGRAAENAAQYLQKGRSVLIEGRLQMETWQDKQSGQERSKLKVVADTLQYLGSSHDSAASGGDDRHEGRSGEGRRQESRGEERREQRSSRDRRYEAA